MPKEKKDSNIRVEKHLLTPESPWYAMIADFCHRAKNLYNHGNYLVRQKFVGERLWTRYQELDSILKHDIEYPDYKAMPTAQSAQQVLRDYCALKAPGLTSISATVPPFSPGQSTVERQLNTRKI